MKKTIVSLFLLCGMWSAGAQNGNGSTQKPRLIVNIVVSQMRYDYLDRFYDNFTDNGFKLFIDRGVNFRSARYGYMQTNTVAGLATISTGTNPSIHGVVSENWIDYTTSRKINIIEDYDVRGLETDYGIGTYSPYNLSAATIGDRLREGDDRSKAISIASDPVSAIVSGGPSAQAFWMDIGRGNWISSSYYFDALPFWVQDYNKSKFPAAFVNRDWTLTYSPSGYRNTEMTVLRPQGDTKPFLKNFFSNVVKIFKGDDEKHDYASIHYTPFGNMVVGSFAREAVMREGLGRDEHTDLLTVCFDSPRLIAERFGPRSTEVEDMYYKLDFEIGELVGFINAQFDNGEVMFVLTSDHGSSDTYQEGSKIPTGLFNAQQFKMIMNGFLSAQYEPGEWVLDYIDRQLYLNRDMIYTYGLVLSEVQTRASAFVLQFRGVANAMTSTAMQNSYFGQGVGEKIQNGFYPKRSGDITINLMPGWIEDDDGKVSLPGSLYEYDVHVPLMFYSPRLAPAKINRDVDMTSVAPTLARIMHLTPPNASTGEILTEITSAYEN